MRWIYIVDASGEIYSSRKKAHKRLCEIVNKKEDEFLPTKERKVYGCKGWIKIHYPNFYLITKKHLL